MEETTTEPLNDTTMEENELDSSYYMELSDEQLQVLKDLFTECDQDADGKIDREELRATMLRFVKNDQPVTDEQLDDLMAQLDRDKKGYVDFVGFIAGFAPLLAAQDESVLSSEQADQVRAIFNTITQDEDGFLDASELSKFLQTISTLTGKNTDPLRLQGVVETMSQKKMDSETFLEAINLYLLGKEIVFKDADPEVKSDDKGTEHFVSASPPREFSLTESGDRIDTYKKRFSSYSESPSDRSQILTEQLEGALNDQQAMETTIQRLRDEVTTMRDMNCELVDSLSMVKEQATELKKRLKQSDKLKITQRQLENQMETLREELAAVKASKKDIKKLSTRLTREKEQLTKNFSEKLEELTSSHAHLNEVIERMKHKQATEASNEAEAVASRENEYTNLREEFQQYKHLSDEKINTKDEQVAQLHNQLEEMKKQYKETKAFLKSAEQNVATLQSNLEEQQAQSQLSLSQMMSSPLNQSKGSLFAEIMSPIDLLPSPPQSPRESEVSTKDRPKAPDASPIHPTAPKTTKEQPILPPLSFDDDEKPSKRPNTDSSAGSKMNLKKSKSDTSPRLPRESASAELPPLPSSSPPKKDSTILTPANGKVTGEVASLAQDLNSMSQNPPQRSRPRALSSFSMSSRSTPVTPAVEHLPLGLIKTNQNKSGSMTTAFPVVNYQNLFKPQQALPFNFESQAPSVAVVTPITPAFAPFASGSFSMKDRKRLNAKISQYNTAGPTVFSPGPAPKQSELLSSTMNSSSSAQNSSLMMSTLTDGAVGKAVKRSTSATVAKTVSNESLIQMITDKAAKEKDDLNQRIRALERERQELENKLQKQAAWKTEQEDEIARLEEENRALLEENKKKKIERSGSKKQSENGAPLSPRGIDKSQEVEPLIVKEPSQESRGRKMSVLEEGYKSAPMLNSKKEEGCCSCCCIS